MSSKKGKTVTIQLRPVYHAAPRRSSSGLQPTTSGAAAAAAAAESFPHVHPVAIKSRYKIYEIPRKSEFSEYLERIRREQEAKQAGAQRTLADHGAEPGPSRRRGEPEQKLLKFDKPMSTMRQGSVVEYRPKQRHPFKELVCDYLRRSSHSKQTLRVYKIPIVQSWEQAIEASLRKLTADRSRRGDAWKHSRLKWLEDLEAANATVPEQRRNGSVDSEAGIDASICCFPLCRRHNGGRAS
uniref:Uncharacterized protein n=1 Tax=Anopheles dirus TaxID=7168 RepID=A0A182N557_9DIPT